MPTILPPKAQLFLSELAEEIRRVKTRDSTLEEIATHLLDSIEQLQNEGLSEEQAVQQALSRLGDPRKLGKALRAAHRPWYLRWFFLLPSSFALACLLAIAALGVLTEISLRQTEEQIRQQHRSLALFFNDQETLQKYPFLAPTGRLYDAGAFLNTRVPWQGASAAERFRKPAFYIDEKTRLLLKGDGWWAKAEPKELASIDLSWMKELQQFDHWDLWLTEGGGRENIERGFVWGETTVPSYAPLVTMAKMRYLRALKKGDALQALREVRHLTVLIHSNELLIASMFAVSLFKVEKEFYEEAVRRNLIRAGDWAPLSEGDRLAFKRVAYSAGEWTDLLSPPEMLQQFTERSATMVGICGSLMESQSLRLRTNAYFEPRIWPEADMRPNFERINKMLESNKSRCRLTYFKQASHLNQTARYGAYGNPLKDILLEWGVRIPYLRRFEGASFHRDARPSWAFQYYSLVEQEKAIARLPAQVRHR